MLFGENNDDMGDAEARHLEMKLLPLSIDELDMSRPYILRSLGLARSLVLGMHSGIPSRSSRVDWRENSVVASVKALTGGESDACSDQWREVCDRINIAQTQTGDSYYIV